MFVIFFPEICYSFLKNLKILLRAKFNALLATVLRLSVIQKQETTETINAIFVASTKNLKNIANRSDSIGVTLN